jgi:hypothetical protein
VTITELPQLSIERNRPVANRTCKSATQAARLGRQEKLIDPAKSLPQGLKHGRIFNGLSARLKFVPFPTLFRPEFLRSL